MATSGRGTGIAGYMRSSSASCGSAPLTRCKWPPVLSTNLFQPNPFTRSKPIAKPNKCTQIQYQLAPLSLCMQSDRACVPRPGMPDLVFGKAMAMTRSDLQVRLRIKEALARVEDARFATADAWTSSRLQHIARDLEETLTYLAPDRIGPCPRKAAVARRTGLI
jgi:hypothetical protein